MALTPERKKEIEEEEAYRLKARKKAKRDEKAREWRRGFVGLVVIVGVVWGAIELFGDEEEKQKPRTAGLSSEQTSKIRKSLDFLSQVNRHCPFIKDRDLTVNSRVPTDTNSLERLVPEHIQAGDVTGKETLKLHLDRYEFAARHIRPEPALDIACGVGYGTHLLAERCGDGTEFIGVDISSETVEYARGNYSRAKVRFEVGDAMRFEDPNGFDTIISLETIEHLPDPKGFVARLVKLLRPRGMLIGSVPTTPSVDANPHHLHDFTERSFRKMVSVHGLREIDCFRQVQPFHPVPLLSRREVWAPSCQSRV